MIRIGLISLRMIIGGILLLLSACNAGEGERCNPQQFQVSDQCTEGLNCTYPTNCGLVACMQVNNMTLDQCKTACAAVSPPLGCGVAYCCPPRVTATTDPNCQPCTLPDGGTPG